MILFDEPLTQKDKSDEDLSVLFSAVQGLKQLPKPIPIKRDRKIGFECF